MVTPPPVAPFEVPAAAYAQALESMLIDSTKGLAVIKAYALVLESQVVELRTRLEIAEAKIKIFTEPAATIAE